MQYNIVGTVHHSPSGPDQGHYTSICKSQQSQSRNWFNYNDPEVSFSHFTNKRNDKVLKGHTKTATILFYVSGALQTRIRSRSPIVDLQDDTTSYSSPVNDEDGTGEGGGEDDATTSSSSEIVSNNCISQAFLQRVEGHYCYLCCEQHYLTTTDLATFETEAQCEHVYCYVSLQRRKTASVNGDLTCPECMCIALNIIHHQPIRLDEWIPLPEEHFAGGIGKK